MLLCAMRSDLAATGLDIDSFLPTPERVRPVPSLIGVPAQAAIHRDLSSIFLQFLPCSYVTKKGSHHIVLPSSYKSAPSSTPFESLDRKNNQRIISKVR